MRYNSYSLILPNTHYVLLFHPAGYEGTRRVLHRRSYRIGDGLSYRQRFAAYYSLR